MQLLNLGKGAAGCACVGIEDAAELGVDQRGTTDPGRERGLGLGTRPDACRDLPATLPGPIVNGVTRRIDTARIDVPLERTFAYLYAEPTHGSDWDPWWASLFEYLVRFMPPEAEWSYEPVQGVHVAKVPLSESERARLLDYLRTAPKREIARRITLRRAAQLSPEKATRMRLRFFHDSRR